MLVVVGVFVGTEIAYFAPGDPTVPEFGRYLFPVAGAIAGARGARRRSGAGGGARRRSPRACSRR